eukprot:TRINITY_DN3409_c0_g1_i1.p1 TRINITY_DN3409_c0_g1~~TRINITY_DN3409_c0_g1_i1.p1  ORF type:complete len:349 (+),score=39.96 TRINITY_DN3409_c0_g1_i1:66-1112(+)
MLATCQVFNKCLCPENRPSPIFLLFSLLVNILCIIFAIVGLNAKKDGEGGNPDTWLAIVACISGVSIMFAFYLYYRFHKLTVGSGVNTHEQMSPWKAAFQLFMYDIGVFLYILFAIFILVWSFTMSNYKCKDDCDDKHSAMETCRTTQLIYLFLGGFVVALSLCTQCCKEPRHQRVTVVTYGGGGGGRGQQNPNLQQNATRVGTAVGTAVGKGVGAVKGVLGGIGGNSQPSQAPPAPQNYQTAYEQPPPQQYQQAPAYNQSQQWSAPAPQYSAPAPQYSAPAPPPQQQAPPQPQCTPADYPPEAAPAPSAPPASQQPPPQQTTSEKVGSAVGSALGKGIGALKGISKK